MRVLVAGGSGFIGKNFLLHAPQTWECWATFGKQNEFPQFLKTMGLNHVHPIKAHWATPAGVQETFSVSPKEFDVCLYVMGNSDIGLSRRDPLYDLTENVHAILNLLQTIRCKKFIFMSSGAVYEGQRALVTPQSAVSPLIPYALHKFISERYLAFFQKHTDHLDHYVSIRFFGAYGPYEPSRKIFTKLIEAFRFRGEKHFTLQGNGLNLIDAMYIDDAIEALLRVCQGPPENKIVDLCGGNPQNLNQLVTAVADSFEVRPFELRHEGDAAEYTTFFASTEGFAKAYGFQPRVSLKEGMQRFYEFLKGK